MKYVVNMLLSDEASQTYSSVAVVTADDYRKKEKDLKVGFSQVIIYGKKNKKLKLEFPHATFVNSPGELFKKAQYRTIWVLSKELFFHLNRWIDIIYSDKEEDVDKDMRHDRQQTDGIFALFAWERLKHINCITEYFLKPYSSLSGGEKERVMNEVITFLKSKVYPLMFMKLERAAVSIKSRYSLVGKGSITYTVDLFTYPAKKLLATVVFVENLQSDTISQKLTIYC